MNLEGTIYSIDDLMGAITQIQHFILISEADRLELFDDHKGYKQRIADAIKSLGYSDVHLKKEETNDY